MNKRYYTQWAAQFYASAELTRRGYLVSLTLGNAPTIDLLVSSETGNKFQVDVKGLSSKNFWLIREKKPEEDLYYILVYLPPNLERPEFFIVTSKRLMQEIQNLKKLTLANGKNWTENGSGINWGQALQFKDKWDVLPK